MTIITLISKKNKLQQNIWWNDVHTYINIITIYNYFTRFATEQLSNNQVIFSHKKTS